MSERGTEEEPSVNGDSVLRSSPKAVKKKETKQIGIPNPTAQCSTMHASSCQREGPNALARIIYTILPGCTSHG